jgi:hypothetical protein
MNPVDILLLISDLEGSYHHLRINGFDDDKDVVREMCNRYYKMYFKLCKEQKRKPY